MLDYLRKRQRETKAQEAGTEQAAVPAGVSNQAMLSMLESQQARPVARPVSGGTPLADAMRAKFERQFGLPMDDVRIHRDSAEPAKFDAGAYTYGSDIFIGPGQEELLSHEMTHVAQQKMGQVHPTGMENGMAVNHSPALEHSADTGAVAQTMGTAAGPVVQCGPNRESADYLPALSTNDKRHHIIPYGDMKKLAMILQEYNPNLFNELGNIAVQTYTKVLNNGKDEEARTRFLTELETIKQLQASGSEDATARKSSFYHSLFAWLPGNLTVGPSRTDDPGNHYDAVAAKVHSNILKGKDHFDEAGFEAVHKTISEILKFSDDIESNGRYRAIPYQQSGIEVRLPEHRPIIISRPHRPPINSIIPKLKYHQKLMPSKDVERIKTYLGKKT